MTKIIVGTRGSKLALLQTDMIIARLKELEPDIDFSITKIVTSGDWDQHSHLNCIGINVFVKELEEALLDQRIDIAVHSLKDVPTELPSGLGLLATPDREDPRDVLVAKAKLEELAPGSRIGTGSLRRSVQLKQFRPDIEVCGIRGNVDTRLHKANSSEYDGVIMAAAAMARMGWQARITQYLPAENFLPAVGQGALVVEGRLKDKGLAELVSRLNHLPTWKATKAERAFLLTLGGGCRAPIGALGTVNGNRIKLEGMIASPSGKGMFRDSAEGDANSAEKIGAQLAEKMLDMGASGIIAEVKA